MNILIPHSWLLEHLDTKATPEKIRECLSLCGPSVERIEIIEGEPVYDIEVTTNRVDCMSVRGIAREAATILPQFNISATLKPLPTKYQTIDKLTQKLPIVDISFNNDPNLCKRIMAVVMTVKIGDSPEYIQKRLRQIGQRPLNNVVDITNYVMWETGHPTHVFDYHSFTQKKLIVREAQKGEQIVTLDKKKYSSVGGEVIFDDGTGTIIDMPGLMGTQNTVVTAKTTKILFFIDSVVADKIRFASMTHSIRTQAAVLNEKHVDPILGTEAMYRGIELYQQAAQGTLVSKIYDDFPNSEKPPIITIKQHLIDTYLGIHVKPTQVKQILETLGCTVETKFPEYLVTPPSFRVRDLEIPQDLIEEIARIYGYHNLPSNIMNTPIPLVATNLNHTLEHLIKTSLADWGLHEVYTYSLVSAFIAEKSGKPVDAHLRLANPLNDDLLYLRQTLIPSHAQVFEDNKVHKGLLIFEMANTYWPKADTHLPDEILELVISSRDSYIDLKQALDKLMRKLRVSDYHINPGLNKLEYPEFDDQISGEIMSNNIRIGVIGRSYSGVYAAQIDIYKLITVTHSYPHYSPIPTTSGIVEDLTFTMPTRTHIQPVIRSISKLHSNINSVNLKSVYNQNFTFTITYLDKTSQLTVGQIAPIRKQIIDHISQTFKSSLVGSITN